MYFSQIEFYRLDYAESDVIVPSRTATFSGTPIKTISEPVYPTRSEIFSRFRLNGLREQVVDANYLRITLVSSIDGATATTTLYGWIDSVTSVSDGLETVGVIEVAWHTDYWRSYISTAHLGWGLVTRRNFSDNDPPQPLAPNVTSWQAVKDLVATSNPLWVILGINKTTNDTRTQHRFAFFPVRYPDIETIPYIKLSSDTTPYPAPSLGEMISGEYVNKLGIDPQNVTSAYISPMAPVPIAGGSGTNTDPWYVVGSSGRITTSGSVPDGNFPYCGRLNGDDETRPTVYFYNSRMERQTKDDFWKYNEDAQHYWGYKGCCIDNWCGDLGIKYSVKFEFRVYANGSDVFRSAPSEVEGGRYTDALRVMRVSDVMKAVGVSSVRSNDTFRLHGSWLKAHFSGYHKVHTEGILDPTFVRIECGDLVTGDDFTFSPSQFDLWLVMIGDDISGVQWEFTTDAVNVNDLGIEQSGSDAYFYTKTGHYQVQRETFDSLRTEDYSTLGVTDWNGVLLASLPWHTPVTYVDKCLVMSTASAYIRLRFDGINSSAEGLEVSIPLPTLAVISNAWSSYLYSGQRDADLAQTRLANEAAMMNAVAGGIESAAMGAVLGGIGAAGEIGASATIASKAGTAGVMGGGSIISGLIGAAIQADQAGKLQGVKDTVMKRQPSSVITDSSGADWIWNGRAISLVRSIPDDYSLARWAVDIYLNGVRVSETWYDADTLLDKTGPLRFDDVQVYGEMPVEAQKYIKQRLIKGVRLQ